MLNLYEFHWTSHVFKMSTVTLHAKAKLNNQKADIDKNHNNFSI